MIRVPLSYMRGGTSKAAVFLADDLPDDGAERDRILLHVMGSPDGHRRQLNGLGGGTSSTSKVAIVGPGDGDHDVTFLFAQVGIDRTVVDLTGTCGNISAAIGPFAIEHGLVSATGERTRVRVLNRNTGTAYLADVDTRDGRFEPEGDFAIAGVSGTGSRIDLAFLEPAGAVTGALLPTGEVLETIDDVEVSIVDAANPVVFLRAEALGVAADMTPAALDDQALLHRIERIRQEASVRAGIADAAHAASVVVPRVALVAADDEHTVRGLMVSAGRPHPAYPFTGAIATAVAARVPGTVVHGVARPGGGAVIIRHPAGVIELDVVGAVRDGGFAVDRVTSSRTARELMRGWVEVPDRS